MNLLGIDFEDWFHPELVKHYIVKKEKKPTVINGIDKILDWLRKNETYATFFTVGELLEYKPDLLDKIIAGGHEIAFHTMHHTKLDTPGYKEKFSEEIKIFEKLTSKKSKGFRAPTFSLNHTSAWALDILTENNYSYDSSIVPVKTKMYGISNAEIKPYKISSSSLKRNDVNGKLIEFPLLTTRFLGMKLPAAGGFYLRILPLKTIENAIQANNKRDIPASFYIHSWELTPEFMPKLSLPPIANFVTYYNIGNTLSKMNKIIKKFKFTSFSKFLSNYNFL